MMRLRGIAWLLVDRQLGNVEEQKKALAQVRPFAQARLGSQEGTSTPEEVTKQVLPNGEVH